MRQRVLSALLVDLLVTLSPAAPQSTAFLGQDATLYTTAPLPGPNALITRKPTFQWGSQAPLYRLGAFLRLNAWGLLTFVPP